VNQADANYAPGEAIESARSTEWNSLFSLRSLDDVRISPERAALVQHVLGLNEGLDWIEVRRILHRSFREWSLSFRPASFPASRISKSVRRIGQTRQNG